MADDLYTTEAWKTIPFAPEYAASSHGRIKRVISHPKSPAGKILKAAVSYGYEHIVLYVDGKRVPQRVSACILTAFVGPRPTPTHQAAHWDGDRRNNRLENLRWATPKENSADKARHGRAPIGSRHWNSKLTEDDVRAMYRMREQGLQLKEIAAQFAVTASCACNAMLRGWRHVERPKP